MKRLVSMIMTLMMLLSLSACGNTASNEVPELLAPKGSETVYEAAQIRDVGKSTSTSNKIAYVAMCVPDERCQFFEKNVRIDEIKVKVGDYVKKGDVLAVVDTEDIRRRIDALHDEITYREGLFALDEAKYEYEYTAARCESDLAKWDMNANLEGYSKKDRENVNGSLNEFIEDHELNIKLHEFNLRCLNDEIAQYNKLLEHTTLVADCDGYVTYIKDLNQSMDCGTEENVVRIADLDSKHLEIMNLDCEKTIFDKYEDCVCYIDGVKYQVHEDMYSSMEYMVMQSKKKYANVKVAIEGFDGDFELGDCIEVIFRNNFSRDVVSVHKDSVYEDKDGKFLYVKNGDTEERRPVTIGNTDREYTEIVSGLSAGEEVRREVNPLVKEDDVIKAGIKEKTVKNYRLSENADKQYFAKKSGIVDNILKSGGIAEPGEVIFTMKTTGSKSEVVRLENEIENNAYSFNATCDSIDEIIKGYDKSIYNDIMIPLSNVREALKGDMSDNDRQNLEETDQKLSTRKEILEARKSAAMMDVEIAKFNFLYQDSVLKSELAQAKKDLNGEGSIDVKVKEECRVDKVHVKQGSNIKEGDLVLTVKVPSERSMVVYTEDPMSIGQGVRFKNKDYDFTGHITGFLSSPVNRYFTTYIGDEVFLTVDSNNSRQYVYYVTMDDEKAYDYISYDYECRVSIFMTEQIIENDKTNK